MASTTPAEKPPGSSSIPPLVLGLLVAGLLAGALGAMLLLLGPRLGAPASSAGLARTVGGVVVLTGIGLVAAALAVAAFEPVWHGRAAEGFGSHRVMLRATALAVLLALLLGNLLPLLVLRLTGQHGLQNVPGFLAAAVSVDLALLGVAYFRFIRPGVVSWRDFGFARNRFAEAFFGQVWLTQIATGLGGGVLILLLSAAAQALLQAAGVQQTQQQEYTWVAQLPPSGFILVVLAGAVVAPFAEEVFFRGLVFRAYLRAKGPLVAYLVSAGLFALLHLNLPALAPILVLGLVLAWLYRTTGSLTPCVLAHGLNNSVAFLALYLSSRIAGLGGG